MKRLLSYLFPLKSRSYTSAVNGALEINLKNGKKTLDTNTVNQSYGLMEKVLHQGLLELKFNQDVNYVLVLGLGGGTIVQTIRQDFQSDAFIELVDIDPTMILIAKNEFEIEKFKNINIVESDAFKYLENTKKLFDVIIIDIFIIDAIPLQFTQPDFLNLVTDHLYGGGKVIFNTISTTLAKEVLKGITSYFESNGYTVKILENNETFNELILATKIADN